VSFPRNLSGVSLESILPQIARAVRHHFQAKFVALGTPGIRPVFAEGWDGPPEWRAMLEQESILKLWHTAGQDGRQAELSSKDLSKLLRPAFDRGHTALNRVIAVPVELASHVFWCFDVGLEHVELPTMMIRILTPTHSWRLPHSTGSAREWNARRRKTHLKST